MNKKISLFLCCIIFLLAFTPPIHTRNFLHNIPDTLTPIIFYAKDHKGINVVAANDAITFTSGLYNDYFPMDSLNRTGYFYIEASVLKRSQENVKRIPLNISIVIDRSGSMQGIKMGYAKKAAKGIIDLLNSADIVSVVVYDTYVDTIQSPVNVINKEKIKARIDKIVPRASTNLWGGAEQGYQYVLKNYKPAYCNRVLLISDGNANTGLTDSTMICKKVQEYKDVTGITLSTFGVGLDYNETLMTTMAETGAGNYYFIDKPEKLTDIFNTELNLLRNVVAQNAELKIKLPAGIKIKNVYPLQFLKTGDELVVKLRDLSFEETKAMLVSFTIGNNENSALKFTSSLSYWDAGDGRQKVISNQNVLSPIKKPNDYLTHFNKKVIQQIILYTANEKLENAMNLIEKGKSVSAKIFLTQNKQYLKNNIFYVQNDRALLKMDSLNNVYFEKYFKTSSLNMDSVKKFQKAAKAANYQLRSKKQ